MVACTQALLEPPEPEATVHLPGCAHCKSRKQTTPPLQSLTNPCMYDLCAHDVRKAASLTERAHQHLILSDIGGAAVAQVALVAVKEHLNGQKSASGGCLYITTWLQERAWPCDCAVVQVACSNVWHGEWLATCQKQAFLPFSVTDLGCLRQQGLLQTLCSVHPAQRRQCAQRHSRFQTPPGRKRSGPQGCPGGLTAGVQPDKHRIRLYGVCRGIDCRGMCRHINCPCRGTGRDKLSEMPWEAGTERMEAVGQCFERDRDELSHLRVTGMLELLNRNLCSRVHYYKHCLEHAQAKFLKREPDINHPHSINGTFCAPGRS